MRFKTSTKFRQENYSLDTEGIQLRQPFGLLGKPTQALPQVRSLLTFRNKHKRIISAEDDRLWLWAIDAPAFEPRISWQLARIQFARRLV